MNAIVLDNQSNCFRKPPREVRWRQCFPHIRPLSVNSHLSFSKPNKYLRGFCTNDGKIRFPFGCSKRNVSLTLETLKMDLTARVLNDKLLYCVAQLTDYCLRSDNLSTTPNSEYRHRCMTTYISILIIDDIKVTFSHSILDTESTLDRPREVDNRIIMTRRVFGESWYSWTAKKQEKPKYKETKKIKERIDLTIDGLRRQRRLTIASIKC